MDGDKDKKEGYNKIREQILELCKLAQGNITTIIWCKSQIKRRLRVLDRLVERLAHLKDSEEISKKLKPNAHERIEKLIKKQTDACKELGDKIKTEIESLDAIRVASKAYGIDIKTRLLEIDNKLDLTDVDEFFSDSEE